MASRAHAYSQWLPGFDPDEQFPDLFADQDVSSVVHSPLAPRVETAPCVTAEVEEDARPQPLAANWRKSVAAESVERVLWWPLASGDLGAFGGPVAKFEANLVAIESLRRIEMENRAPTVDEATDLRRFTGWGGLPASFNLENSDAPWLARAHALRALLSEDEYESARASVNNGHYTEIHVIEAIWRAIERLGFTGGRILEPAAGVGHFIGAMPRAIAERSQVSAIEIDRISGRILKALYGAAGVDVRIAPFEKTMLSDDWFDLVIGNVPFGKYKVADPNNRTYCRFSIHNYFFGRALDLVRPGGLVCLITSCYTLDSTDDEVRRYLASRAELIGAIRLPKGTFADIAGTQIQTDILFLRKGHRADEADAGWIRLKAVPDVLRHPQCYARYLPINAWYAEHPKFCIGKITQESNGFEEVATAVFDGELPRALIECVDRMPSGVYVPEAKKSVQPRLVAPTVPAAAGARPGSFRIHRARVHRVEGAGMVDVHGELNATQRGRIAGMCAIRDQARALLDAQLADMSDEELACLRGLLNNAYDRFVAKHGCLSTRANALAFRRDPDYPLLLSLEHYDEESDRATKAALFSRRTLSRIKEPASVALPEEALAASVQWRGKVDPAYMGRLLACPEEAVIEALAEHGQVFLDPANDEWKTADAYLSGNVKTKLKQAVSMGARFRRNVEALERVQPEDLPPAAIEPRLGAVWIPATDVEAFIQEVLELKDCTVTYSAQAGAWSIQYQSWTARQNVKVTQEWGTSRMDAVELVQCALNVQVPTVRDRDPVTDRYFVNAAETLAAREKLGLLKERFARWAFDDTARRERLCQIYNGLFNATRPRTFDGSHLALPGFSHCFALHPHQKDSIWRVVQSGNTGLFHVVGAGKTAVCVAASMELRRLGFVNKPCHVVPNHVLAQVRQEVA